MLLQGIGRGIEVHQVDMSVYKQAIVMLRDAEVGSVENYSN
jgi:3-dehydroquinate synthase